MRGVSEVEIIFGFFFFFFRQKTAYEISACLVGSEMCIGDMISIASTACRHSVSGSISLLYSRCFSPFPHGAGSLSVSG